MVARLDGEILETIPGEVEADNRSAAREMAHQNGEVSEQDSPVHVRCIASVDTVPPNTILDGFGDTRKNGSPSERDQERGYHLRTSNIGPRVFTSEDDTIVGFESGDIVTRFLRYDQRSSTQIQTTTRTTPSPNPGDSLRREGLPPSRC